MAVIFSRVLLFSFVLWSALCVAKSGTPGSQFQFERVGDALSIPDNVVTDMAQDPAGFLWIATPAGVVRHDGYRFKLFTHAENRAESLSGNFVRHIKVLDDGTIWLSTEPGGVSVYHPASEQFVRLFDAETLNAYPALSSVSNVTQGPSGNFWLATNNGVFQVDAQGDVLQHYTKAHGLPSSALRTLLSDRQGQLWAGTRSGLARYDPRHNTFSAVAALSNETSASLYIRSLYESDDGRLWVGTNKSGLWVLDNQASALRQVQLSADIARLASPIYDILQYDQQELWLARFGGIDRISLSDEQPLSRILHDPSDTFSLANNDIRALLKDRSGVMWVGGYGGGVQRMLNNVKGVATLRYSMLRDNALTEPNVSSVLVRSNGNIWVGTRGDGINIVARDQGVIDGHHPQPGEAGKLDAGWITTMAEMPDGSIWVGVNPALLYRFNPQDNTFTRYQDGLQQANVRALQPSARGGLWIGTNNGLSYWDARQDAIVPVRFSDDTLLRDGINALYEDAHGKLLVATGSSGVYEVPADQFTLHALQGINEQGRKLRTLSIVGMLVDSKQRLWLDTPLGLYRVDINDAGQLSLSNISAATGFAGQPMGANLLEDARGRIWTPSFLYDPDSHTMKALQRADGIDIGTSWFRAYAQTTDDMMLFGGSKGLLMIKPQEFKFWDYMPQLVISELYINGKAANAGALTDTGLRLGPDKRQFSVEFAALDLSAPLSNRYQFMLEGYDADWITTDATRRVASYSNLWPGRYTLRVRGSNRTGQWSNDALNFDVTVQPAFWQTLWFLALMVGLATAAITLGVKLRTRVMRQRAAELEAQVEERTRKLKEAQNDLIEREKLASLGALVAGVSHEINTPLGIALTAASGLDDDSKSLRNKLNEQQLTKTQLTTYLDKVVASIEIVLSSLNRASKLIQSFRQVSVDQTSEQRRTFDMASFLDDLERAMHSVFSHNKHTLVIQCPQNITLDSYPGVLFQVLSNLITNSVVHGFENTTAGTMTLTVTRQHEQLLLRYADNGKGMTDDVKKHAFEPFFTTKLGVGGSGLGLHLVYNYVTGVLGGSVNLDTAASQGFQCTLVLPLRAPVGQA